MKRYFVTDDVNLVNGPFDEDDVRECADADEAAENYANWNYGEEDMPVEVFVVDVSRPGHYDLIEVDVVDGLWSTSLLESA